MSNDEPTADGLAQRLARRLRSGSGTTTVALVTADEGRALELLEECANTLELEVRTWSATHGPMSQWIDEVGRSGDTMWVAFELAAAARTPSERRAVRELAQRTEGPPVVIVESDAGWLVDVPELPIEGAPAPGADEIAAHLDAVRRRLERQRRTTVDLGDLGALSRAALGLERRNIDRVLGEVIASAVPVDHATLLHEFTEAKNRLGGDSTTLLERVHPRARDELGGLLAFKAWLDRRRLALAPRARDAGIPYPRGVLLVGVQGCGKSLAARVCGDVLELPMFRLDPGRVFGGTVGESEANLRRVLASVDAMAPIVLWLDEIEKGLAGADATQSDGGTAARVVGTLLTWLQERRRPVFVVATANRVDRLPPELTRRGRLDEVFFVDLPDADARARIVDIHLRIRPERRLGDAPPLADDPAAFLSLGRDADGFSGAELEAALIEARLDALARPAPLGADDFARALAATVPLSRARRETIERMREWAQDRARGA